MIKIHVFSEKTGNFASDSKTKPMIFIDSKRKPLEPGKKDKKGIWQGLKVFEDADVDKTMFWKKEMKGMKRTTTKFGQCLGHRKGLHGEELLEYIEARKLIYLPCYNWVLENKLQKLVTVVRIISKHKPVVLLDYNTNADVNNPHSALSHASLIKAYIEGNSSNSRNFL